MRLGYGPGHIQRKECGFIDVTSGIGREAGLNIEPVLNLVGGAEWGASRPGSRAFRRYLLEIRVGMGDTTPAVRENRIEPSTPSAAG